MNRLEEFCALLGNIYGERIVKLFTTKNENNHTLTMNNEANNQKEKKYYDREEGEGCKICEACFRNKDNTNFFKRILEFPGWIGDLDFSDISPAKEIMIIGEAPTTLKDQINIAFGLGFYPIDNDGKLNFDLLKEIYSGQEIQLKTILKSVRPNRLWEYLNLLFLNKLDIIKPKIYITDLCKCNDDKKDEREVKNTKMWTNCLSECLIEEIKLINPLLIIFQGGSPYTWIMRYLKSQHLIKSKQSILVEIEDYYPKSGEPDYYKEIFSKPCFGKFPLNGKDIYFFKIYHQAARYLKNSDRINYIKQNHQFIERKILEEILKIS